MFARLARNLFLCAALAALAPAAAGAAGIDMAALIAETQKHSPRGDELTMAWWIPGEFWTASLGSAPGMSPEMIGEFLAVVDRYNTFAIVDGTIGPMGGMTFRQEKWVRENTHLVDARGHRYSPLGEGAVDADMKNLLMDMKPVIANAAGPIGQNMHFLLFPVADGEGRPLLPPARETGRFGVEVGKTRFEWHLPLDSLLPAGRCTDCARDTSGSWKFCPWCGRTLGEPGEKERPQD